MTTPKTRREIPLELMLTYLPAAEARRYMLHKHVRVEMVKRDTELVVYRMERGRAVVLDLLAVDDIRIDPQRGLLIELGSEKLGEVIDVTVMPLRPFDFEFFIHLPINPGLRWLPDVDDAGKGDMEVPLVVRTASRYNLRDGDAVHLEQRKEYEAEFGQLEL